LYAKDDAFYRAFFDTMKRMIDFPGMVGWAFGIDIKNVERSVRKLDFEFWP
jgi:hypothetical protein